MKTEQTNVPATAIPEPLPTVRPPDTAPMVLRATSLTDQVAAIKITDEASYKAASELLLLAMDGGKAVEKEFEAAAKAANEVHKLITGMRAKHQAPFNEAVTKLRPMIATWVAEENAKRAAEEARLQEEARKRREEEQINEAEALEKAGKHEEAAEVIERPVVAPAVVAPPPVAKVSGLNMVTVTKFEIIDKTMLKDEFLVADEKSIGALVKSMSARAVEAVSKPAAPGAEFKPAIKVTTTQEPRAAGRRS